MKIRLASGRPWPRRAGIAVLALVVQAVATVIKNVPRKEVATDNPQTSTVGQQHAVLGRQKHVRNVEVRMSLNGAGSEQVKSVQKALQDKGMDPGPIDWVMGPKTMAALKAFQKDQKLTESAKLDDQRAKSWGSPADAPARPG